MLCIAHILAYVLEEIYPKVAYVLEEILLILAYVLENLSCFFIEVDISF